MSLAVNESAPAFSVAGGKEPPFDLVIEPRRGWIGLDIPEMMRFRELLFFLVWRDVKVRYKQTVLGVAWAILQPVFNLILFTLIFGRAAGFSAQVPIPYVLWLYAALLPWTLISTGVSMGGMSLVNSQNLLTKVYFPRLFVPTAVIGGALVDMVFSAAVFSVLIAWHHVAVHWTVIFIPALVALTVMVAMGFAYMLSALTVTYRDFRFLIPLLTTALMFSGMIMIPTANWGWKAHAILSINPVYGLANAWRSVVFGIDWRPMDLLESVAVTAILLTWGMFYFRRTERRFADMA